MGHPSAPTATLVVLATALVAYGAPFTWLRAAGASRDVRVVAWPRAKGRALAQPHSAAADYPHLLAALQAMPEFSTLVAAINTTGMANTFSIPESNYTLLAPVDESFRQLLTLYPTASQVLGSPLLLTYLLAYHVLHRTDTQAVLGIADSASFDTELTSMATVDEVATTLSNVTVIRLDSRTVRTAYVGGKAYGAFLDLTHSITAGNSRIYPLYPRPVGGVLMPPSKLIFGNAYSITLMEALSKTSSLGMLSQLISADPELLGVVTSTDTMTSLFAPTDAAIQELLTRFGTSLRAVMGSTFMRVVLGAHFTAFPVTPELLASLPEDQRAVSFLRATGSNISGPNTGSGDKLQLLLTDKASSTYSVLGPGNTQPSPVLSVPVYGLDNEAGKSNVWVIGGVIMPSGSLPSVPLAPGPDTPPASRSSPPNSTPGGFGRGATVGIACGVAGGGVLLLALAAAWVLRCRRTRMGLLGSYSNIAAKLGSVAPQTAVQVDTHEVLAGQKDGAAAGHKQPPSVRELTIPGLDKEELFVQETAPHYCWTTQTSDGLCPVEAGINDTQLDQQVETRDGQPCCPIVQLSREQVQQQVRVIKTGLLGKGSSALVFKAMWPCRFGPQAMVAVKMLQDGFAHDDTGFLESFTYEATVLSLAQHSAVVRMYGYCLEPPTVCIIMELLQCSLKDVLYKGMPGAACSMGSAGYRPTNSAEGTNIHTKRSTQGSSATSANAHSSRRSAVEFPPSPFVAAYPSKGSEYGQASAIAGSRSQPHEAAMNSCTGTLAVRGIAGSQACTQQELSEQRPHQELTVLQVVALSTDIAAGLAYLHAGKKNKVAQLPGLLPKQKDADGEELVYRVVHRDLKPANILLNSKGVAKISDFGLARQHEHTTLATVHVGAGTLPYMAPELLVGAGPLMLAPTNRVDIYSLGMLMWEMLAGEPPWRGMAEHAILAAVVAGQRPFLEPGVREQVGPMAGPMHVTTSFSALAALHDIIMRCWDNREHRRPRAVEVHAMLHGLLQQLQPR